MSLRKLDVKWYEQTSNLRKAELTLKKVNRRSVAQLNIEISVPLPQIPKWVARALAQSMSKTIYPDKPDIVVALAYIEDSRLFAWAAEEGRYNLCLLYILGQLYQQNYIEIIDDGLPSKGE